MLPKLGDSTSDVVSFRGFRGITSVPVLTGTEKRLSFDEVPIIDFTEMLSDSFEDRLRLADQVRVAFIEAGVLYAINHGISQSLVDDIHRVSMEFFQLPQGEKMKVHNSKSEAKRGYQYLLEGRSDDPERGDFRECFKMVSSPKDLESSFQPSHDPIGIPNIWPENPPDFRDCLSRYNLALQKFSEKFTKILALSLGGKENALEDVINPFCGLSTFRYPPSDKHNNDGRAVHTDYSLFTILTQLSSITALEVLDRNGHFIPVPPVEGSVVINVGDFAQRISNDIFSSTIHRVINYSPQERLSIAYFLDVHPLAWIEPLKSCGVPKYEGIRAADWQPELLLLPQYKRIDETC